MTCNVYSSFRFKIMESVLPLHRFHQLTGLCRIRSNKKIRDQSGAASISDFDLASLTGITPLVLPYCGDGCGLLFSFLPASY